MDERIGNFKHILIEHLNSEGIDGVEFIKAMIGSKGYLSGSLILRLLTNVDWKSNDVDVFIPVGNHTLANYLQIKGFKGEESKTEPGYVMPYFDTGSLVLAPEDSADIKNIVAFKGGKDVTIQLIYVKFCAYIPSMIRKNFDISVCKNYFDGEGLVCFHLDHIKRQQFSATFHTVNTDYIVQRISRINKYISRGYTLIGIYTW